MNREDIIRMAKNSGLFVELVLERDLDWLERFAALVASHALVEPCCGNYDQCQKVCMPRAASAEREACIKACEQVTADLKNYASAFEGITAETKFIRNIGAVVGEPFIEAIRVRGQE